MEKGGEEEKRDPIETTIFDMATASPLEREPTFSSSYYASIFY
jgi:hypothetical protein